MSDFGARANKLANLEALLAKAKPGSQQEQEIKNLIGGMERTQQEHIEGVQGEGGQPKSVSEVNINNK